MFTNIIYRLNKNVIFVLYIDTVKYQVSRAVYRVTAGSGCVTVGPVSIVATGTAALSDAAAT